MAPRELLAGRESLATKKAGNEQLNSLCFGMVLFYVFLAGLVTALATGLGPLALWSKRLRSSEGQAAAMFLAAVLMLLMSVWLLHEAWQMAITATIFGAVIGCAATGFVSHWSHRWEAQQQEQKGPGLHRMTWLTILVLTAHSAAEGMAVGVAPAGSTELGIFVTVSMAIHNIPEGLAIALVAIPAGMSMRKAVAWSIFSSLPQPLLAVPAFLMVHWYAPLLPIGLGMAAGAMAWLCIGDLIPEAVQLWQQRKKSSKSGKVSRKTGVHAKVQ